MRPSIDDVRSMGEVHSLYRWNMYFINFPTAVGSPPTREELNRRCVTTTLPKVTFNDTLVNMRGHTIELPGRATYERRLTLTMLETVDVKVAQFLSDWRQAQWADGTGVANDKSDCEATIRLELLNNQDEATWEYVLIGCMLKDTTPNQLLEESDEVNKPEMIISYDYFKDGAPGTVTGSNAALTT